MSILFILIAGGYETTAGLLTSSLTVLGYHHPDQLALLRDKPELIPSGVEELLRYVPLAWCTSEWLALQDVELSGVRVPAGATVVVLHYSANRDEALLAEPDRLDGVATLLRRLPGLRPAVPESELKLGILTVGPRALPVTWWPSLARATRRPRASASSGHARGVDATSRLR